MWAEKDEQKREILTDEIIKTELKEYKKEKIIEVITRSLDFLVIIGLLIISFYQPLEWLLIAAYILLPIALIAKGYQIAREAIILGNLIANKSNFTVKKQNVARTEDKSYSTHRPYMQIIRMYFYFSGYDRYKYPDGDHKADKSLYKRCANGFNFLNSYDQFYLVVVGKKIALLYNAKFFEYTILEKP